MKALSQKRRHPLAAIALLLMGLLVTGGLYAVATTVNQAKATTSFSANDAEEGGKLFAANCATCHGMGASGYAKTAPPWSASALPPLTSRSAPAACPCR